MAAPMNEMVQVATRMIFLAWKTSEAEEMSGPKTAWTRDKALGTQVWVAEASRPLPMYVSLTDGQPFPDLVARRLEGEMLTTAGGPCKAKTWTRFSKNIDPSAIQVLAWNSGSLSMSV